MSTALRSPWLTTVVGRELTTALNELKNYVPGTHVSRRQLSLSPDGLAITIRKNQAVQVIGEIEIIDDTLHTVISDGYGCVSARFSDECSNLFQKQYDRKLQSIKGAILLLTDYQLVLHTDRIPSDEIEVLISSFKLRGSEGSMTFGNPSTIMTDKIEALCNQAISYFRLNIEDGLESSISSQKQPNKATSTTQVYSTAIVSQIAFKTQVIDDFQGCSSPNEVSTIDPGSSQNHETTYHQNLILHSGNESDSVQSIEPPHPDWKGRNAKPAAAATLAHEQQGEEGDRSHVQIRGDTSSSVLPFVDLFQAPEPFFGLKRVPRKFARTSKDQNSILEANTWYRRNDKNSIQPASLPASVKASLAQFSDRSNLIPGDEESPQDQDILDNDSEDEKEPEDADIVHSSAQPRSTVAALLESGQEYESSDDGYESDQSDASEQILPLQREFRPIVLASSKEEPIELSSDESSQGSQEASLRGSIEEAIAPVELDMPVVVSGFSSDVEVDESQEATHSSSSAGDVLGVPSTAVVDNLVVQVDRTPYLPLPQRTVSHQKTSNNISSDPCVPATNDEFVLDLQLQHDSGHSKSSSPQIIDQAPEAKESFSLNRDTAMAATSMSEDRGSPNPVMKTSVLDSSPVRDLSDEDRLPSSDNAIIPNLDIKEYPGSGPRTMMKSAKNNPQVLTSSPRLSPRDESASVNDKRRSVTKSKKNGKPWDERWRKWIGKRVHKEEDCASTDAKNMIKQDRHRFKEKQSLENEDLFQNFRHDSGLVSISSIQFSDDHVSRDISNVQTQGIDTIDTRIKSAEPQVLEEVNLSHNLDGMSNKTDGTPGDRIHEASSTQSFPDSPAAEDHARSSTQTGLEQNAVNQDFVLHSLEEVDPISGNAISNELTSSLVLQVPTAEAVFEDLQSHIGHYETTPVTDRSEDEVAIKIENLSNPGGSSKHPSSLAQNGSCSVDAGLIVGHPIKLESGHHVQETQPTEESLPSNTERDISGLAMTNAASDLEPKVMASHAPTTATGDKKIVSEEDFSPVDSTGQQPKIAQLENLKMTANSSTTYFQKFCLEYPQYTGDQSDFTLALVYIEYLLQNSIFGHSHMCDDFIRFYPEDYLALHGDKLKVSGWELFKRKVRKPDFVSDIISADNIDEALKSLDMSEVVKMRSKFEGQERHLILQSRRSSISRGTSISPVRGRSDRESDTPILTSNASELLKGSRQPTSDTQHILTSALPLKQVSANRQPFFDTASQQPLKRKSPAPEVLTPVKRRRTLPWSSTKQSTPCHLSATEHIMSPPANAFNQSSPILGDPNVVPRTVRSATSRNVDPFTNVEKVRDADRRRTLATTTLLEKNRRSSHHPASSFRKSMKRKRKLLVSDPNLFKRFIEEERRASIGGAPSIFSPNITPVSSPGVNGISLKLKSAEKRRANGE